ncbi:hypothetical protein PGTUg99_001567 [Puccinia graminis f. sp. tritici]|uniref:Uncharacterized protein n=1 Tax=Puccinia graminis f. sp. tritici TaxID=56615 RepID=A0A5B0RPE0_PUCGR|nr:hypothetical protein PGTUg99_001567 [Puccinia graminis f. sp. tritici]
MLSLINIQNSLIKMHGVIFTRNCTASAKPLVSSRLALDPLFRRIVEDRTIEPLCLYLWPRNGQLQHPCTTIYPRLNDRRTSAYLLSRKHLARFAIFGCRKVPIRAQECDIRFRSGPPPDIRTRNIRLTQPIWQVLMYHNIQLDTRYLQDASMTQLKGTRLEP